MRNRLLCAVCAALALVSIEAQAQEWDQQRYPDYDPTYSNPEPTLLRFGQANTRRKARAMAEAEALPDHWNNAQTKYFPPIFNQDGGSCGSASRIGYMFTHETNAYRDVSGKTPDNQYPTHFVWLLTNGNSGKDEFVQYVGVPSVQTYGGRTYSKLFGYQEETDDYFGWMTGYDKWLSAFSNRMLKPTTNPYSLATPEGRLAAKAWLYNHAGDEDFHAGGLIGLGVASGGVWRNIPRTPANDAAGVTGSFYVKEWGVSVDHALTLVGYDDRIEFDLDGNGICGEEEKDERGAWIIANSWGGWCNAGFIYCPYAFAGASFNNDGEAGKRTFNQNSWWYGELYKVRKDYRPLRTIKLQMRYSRRSEMLLQAGVSADLNAQEPQATIDLHHFRYAGDGNYGNGTREQTGVDDKGKPTYRNTGIAPSVPMLGKWADGKMHTELMEFGYDLTDLTTGFDRNQPLKYFFIINTKEAAAGVGRIAGASIIDYEYDLQGVETPFDMGEAGYVSVKNKGGRTIISVIVYGASYNAVNNLAYAAGQLTWSAPDRSSHTVASYNVYRDGELIANTTDMTYTVGESTNTQYSVTALYTDQVESAAASCAAPVGLPAQATCIDLEESGMRIPDVFTDTYDQCTIEYWICPTVFANYNNAAGPGWGTWLQHFNSNGTLNAGWDTSSGNRLTTTAFALGEWQHLAIVVNKNKVTAYRNGTQVGTCTSTTRRGIGGFGDYVFSASANSNYHQQARYDEIRIWSTARTANQIKAGMNAEYHGEVMPQGLLAYYRGDTYQQGGKCYLRDYVGGHHAEILTPGDPQQESTLATTAPTEAGTLRIVQPGTVYAGQPVTLSAIRNDAVTHMAWSIPAAGLTDVSTLQPTVTFPTAGEFAISVTGRDYAGNTCSDQLTLQVQAAQPLDATFHTTRNTAPAGERISFVPNSYVPGCTYQWSLPGADTESIAATTAATSYSQVGTYTVTLTVTAPDGTQASESQQVTIQAVAPEASFEVDQTILLRGEKVKLHSTSRYNPTSYQWIIASASRTLVVQNAPADYEFTPETSGAYTVTLVARNEVGSSETTVERAFTVVNADSKNGLSFASSNSGTTGYLLFPQQPIPASDGNGSTFTIDFWLNPSKLSDMCLGIGEDESTFLLCGNAKGELVLTIEGKTVTSYDATLVEGEWHHYCVSHNSAGAVFFYRDGVLINQTASGSISKAMPQCTTFRLGTEAAPMTGSIDELRFWQYSMNEDRVRLISNVPANDESVQAQTWYNKLMHYYDFNQSGGSVLDRVGNLDAQRLNFGPDGDAWGLSRGVFSLDFAQKAQGTDVSATYLTNYKKSFARTSTLVNKSVANRFYELRDWTQENTVTENGVTACAHVDAQKAYCLTVTTGWDGFPNLTNHKCYQSVELPTGLYTLSVAFGQHGAAGSSYLVAAQGTGLPDSDQLEAGALAYAPLADGSISFLVSQPTTVSLGLLTTMSGSSIYTIQSFQLARTEVDIEVGIDQHPAAGQPLPSAQTGTYTLDGMRLPQGTTPQRPGIYIIDGKKVVK